MRLIDADKLKIYVAAAVLDGNKEHKDRGSALFRAIDSMPTAYDVDKVVERLEEVKYEDELLPCSLVVEIEEAKRIIRSGGSGLWRNGKR